MVSFLESPWVANLLNYNIDLTPQLTLLLFFHMGVCEFLDYQILLILSHSTSKYLAHLTLPLKLYLQTLDVVC